MTSANRPAIFIDPDHHDQPFNFCMDLLQNDRVRHANQPIAVVIAVTREAASEGATLLAPTYETGTPRAHLDASPAYVPPMVGVGKPPTAATGDTEAALAKADLTLDVTYETPAQYHKAMEPHAVVASFENGKLIVDTPSQGLAFAAARLGQIFGLAANDVLVRSPYLGGGFGGKGLISGPQVLGALAAKLTGRPVKLVVTRAQIYGPFGHRPPTRQRLRLGATQDGQLTALIHHTKTATSTFDHFYEPASDISPALYASPSISTSHEAVQLDTGTPLFIARPAKPQAPSRWRAPSTRWRRRRASIRWPSGSRTTPKSSRFRANLSCRRRCGNVSRRAPMRSRCRSTESNCARAPPTCRTRGLRAAPAIPPPPGSPCTTRAATRSAS